MSDWFYVRLVKPLPGVRGEIFAFFTEAEAGEFQSCIHATYENARTEMGTVGDATEVFPGWSF